MVSGLGYGYGKCAADPELVGSARSWSRGLTLHDRDRNLLGQQFRVIRVPVEMCEQLTVTIGRTRKAGRYVYVLCLDPTIAFINRLV